MRMRKDKSILGCHVVLHSRSEQRERVKIALLFLLVLSIGTNFFLVLQLHHVTFKRTETTSYYQTQSHREIKIPHKPMSPQVRQILAKAQEQDGSKPRELLHSLQTNTTRKPVENKVPATKIGKVVVQPKKSNQKNKWYPGPIQRPSRANSDAKDNNELRCEQFGGPTNSESLSDMTYWRLDEFATDDSSIQKPRKYLIFEPDEAGFSNIRLSFENVVALAKITNRILVLPPATRFAQLLQGSGIPSYFLSDFFKIRNLPVMPMKEFLQTVELRYRTNHTLAVPPGNRTDWDGRLGNSQQAIPGDGPLLYGFLNSTMQSYEFQRENHIVAVGEGTWTAKALSDIVDKSEAIEKQMQRRTMKFLGHPPAVDAPLSERLQEVMGKRAEIRSTTIYDNETFMFVQGHEDTSYRPLIQFYASYFFEDWKKALWMRRFIRDNLRFADFLQCAAARIVEAMREHARKHGSTDGSFDTMHVRRKDFRTLPNYKEGTVPAATLVEDKYFPENRTVYIATDENDEAYFKPLRDHYHVYFLKDFMHLIEGVDPNHRGMIEQLVCAKGDLFVGTFYSTFTAYINRLRGYYALKNKKPGHLEGSLDSEYFGHRGAPRNVLRNYNAPTYQLWTREWPMAWRDIDHDLEP